MNQDITTTKKHSGLGIVSMFMGVTTGIITFVIFVFAGYLESNTPGGIDDESPLAIIMGAGILLTVFLIFVGTVLGFVGLFQKDKKKLFPAVGSFLNLFLLLGVIGIIILSFIKYG